jgi:type 1 glutamine amidotransferase/sugar phosphate isomerase/epimerase
MDMLSARILLARVTGTWWRWLLLAGTAMAANAAETPASLLPVDAAERQRIDAAIPVRPAVQPVQPRRLLVFDRNVGYGGHPSARHANYAFARMGETTRAFATWISRDPEVFRPESLRHFDAVFFNNTVGNLFEDPALRESLVDFVYAGGGLLGVHGTTVAFTKWPGAVEDWPEFGLLLGARGANHRTSDEHVFIRFDDPGHPLLRPFGGAGWDYRDEFFRVHEPYSRSRVRVLWSIDTAKTDLNQGTGYGQLVRADDDYALAWVRGYGRGRVFYCTVAHNPYVFWDPKMLEFYLGAIQFALGDLTAPTTPSGRLTPAVRAQEQLGWRFGLSPSGSRSGTLWDGIDRAAALGLLYVGAAAGQAVSRELPKPFDADLAPDDLRRVRLKLDSAGVRLLTLRLDHLPEDEPASRRLFAFGRKLGVETFVAPAPPSPAALDAADRLCREYRINLALDGGVGPGQTRRRGPREMLKLCRNRSERIGVHSGPGLWLTNGVDPVPMIRSLGNRLFTLDICEVNRADREARDVPGSTGAGRSESVLRELRRSGIRPTMIGLADAPEGFLPAAEPAECVRSFNRVSLELNQEAHGQPRH